MPRRQRLHRGARDAPLYREAPLNGIWEGTGNLIALDVLRAMEREPDSVDAFLDEVRQASGTDHRLDRFINALAGELADRTDRGHAAAAPSR